MGFNMIFAIVVFSIVYILITTEFINKTISVLAGAVLMIIFGLLDQGNVYSVVDWNVIFLLIGMMIIVGITKHSGLFQFVAIKAAKIAKGNPVTIMVFLFLITAVFSAFLDNVTTVLILVPVTILIAVELGISPIPFIIAETIASNLGGAATLIGDPPNIMIGSAAGLDFLDFLINLGPLVIVMALVTLLFIYLVFRKGMVVTEEKKARIMDFDEKLSLTNLPLLYKSLFVLLLVVIGFIFHGALGLESSIIALAGAVLLLVLVSFPKNDFSEELTSDFYKEVEWGTIFFFIGLFILVEGLVKAGAIHSLAELILEATHGNYSLTLNLLLWGSGLFSALVDNIPYVATMIPLIKEVGMNLTPEKLESLWWVLAIGACIGGNGTLIGASANVVSVGLAKKSGFEITFWDFTKIGFVSTVINLIIASGYFFVRYVVLG